MDEHAPCRRAQPPDADNALEQTSAATPRRNAPTAPATVALAADSTTPRRRRAPESSERRWRRPRRLQRGARVSRRKRNDRLCGAHWRQRARPRRRPASQRRAARRRTTCRPRPGGSCPSTAASATGHARPSHRHRRRPHLSARIVLKPLQRAVRVGRRRLRWRAAAARIASSVNDRLDPIRRPPAPGLTDAAPERTAADDVVDAAHKRVSMLDFVLRRALRAGAVAGRVMTWHP